MKPLLLSTASWALVCAVAFSIPVDAVETLPTAPVRTTKTNSPDNDGKIEFRLRLKAGQSYTARNMYQEKIAITEDGKKADIIFISGSDTRYDVLQVDDAGNMTLKCTYTAASVMRKGPVGKVNYGLEYDSDDKDAKVPDMAKPWALSIGESYRAILSPQGRVLKIEGAEAMAQKIAERIDASSEFMRDALRDQAKMQFSGETLKILLENIFTFYSAKPVVVGETWQSAITGSGGAGTDRQNTWTLRARRDGVAIIDITSQFVSSKDATPVKIGTSEMSDETKGSFFGTIELDEATGWVLKSDIRTQSQSKNLSVTRRPAPQTDIVIKTEMDSSSRARFESFAVASLTTAPVTTVPVTTAPTDR